MIKKIPKAVSLILLSLILGIILSASTYFISRNTTSPAPDICVGPDVVGYECPSSVTHKERGFPVTYYVNDYNNNSDGSSNSNHVSSYLPQKFALNTAILSVLSWAVVMALVSLNKSQHTKKA